MRIATPHMKKVLQRGLMVLAWMVACTFAICAQDNIPKYTVKNGRMFIECSRNLKDADLDRFIKDFDLYELGLKRFIRLNAEDSVRKAGWQIEQNNRNVIVISKPLQPMEDMKEPADKIAIMEKFRSFEERFPVVNNGIVMGYNRFRNKSPFFVKDSMVTFFLRNHTRARRVYLAGNFNDWKPDALAMTPTDSGWIANVRLSAGKWWYKFIIDGRWAVDDDNQNRENDGMGNVNSVFYRPSVTFVLNGYTNASRVYLSGSFNSWQPRVLEMVKTATGWRLPIYLAEGTHTYKYVVDGNWLPDPNNNQRLPDGRGNFNSVVRIGKPHVFTLKGNTNAKTVALAGNFNGWRTDELFLTKTATGWELPYVLGPGNYQYKFIVDNKWVSDPDNPLTADNKMGNSFLIIQPNYTFRLKGKGNAKQVYIAGDFNDWSPNSFPMRKEGDDWVFTVHLHIGKHLYKYIIDGNWVIDPGNKLWEQNEYGTGNSVLWIGK
jgi:hypothetical protein